MEKITEVDKFLTINQKLLIEVKVGDHAGVYDSRIEDMDKSSLHISMPSEKGVTIPLKPNTKLHVSYVMDRGRLSFKTVVEDRFMDPLPMLKVTKPDLLFREELRSFFRVDTRIPVKLMVDIDEGDIIKQKLFEGKIIDMSGGGCRVFTPAPIKKGDVFEMFFQGELEKLESVKVEAKRIRKVEENFEVGSEFYGISQSERDKVIKYVFKRQVELRKLIG
ncbi:MAG: flagellar brake protein [Deferribacterales bacterium]